MKILPATPADWPRIAAAAAADGHLSLAPTHFLEDERGEVRGFFSAGGAACIFLWSHTGNDKFASLRFAKAAIAEGRRAGKPVFVLATKSSPFAPLYEGLGFEELGDATLFRLK